MLYAEDEVRVLRKISIQNVTYIRYTSPVLVGKGYLLFFIWPTYSRKGENEQVNHGESNNATQETRILRQLNDDYYDAIHIALTLFAQMFLQTCFLFLKSSWV